MSKEDKYSIRDLKKEFPTDDKCLEYIFNSNHSQKCSCGGQYHRIKNRKQYQCSKCRYQIAPLAGTIFEKSSTPLTLWFHAIFIFSNAKSGISAKEMERQLGVTYKTAWRILTIIRHNLNNEDNQAPLKGDVEMDEAYFGGKQNAGKNNELLSVAMDKKAVVFGAIERGGQAKVQAMPDAKSMSAYQFVSENIDRLNTKRFITDTSRRYALASVGMDRKKVNHSRKEYVRGDIHINNVESFWSHLKRSIKGTHKVVSKKYLQSYLDGFAWHYNMRHNDRERFVSLLQTLAG